MKVVQKPTWATWVTPKLLRQKPVHRWCVFPHSFASELVHCLIDEWNLTEEDRILDPFCGAGTTILAAREKGIPASGYDLSPFATFAGRVKLGRYERKNMMELGQTLCSRIDSESWNGADGDYPDLVRRALPGPLLGAFESVLREVNRLDCTPSQREFFRLAVLSILPHYSRAAVSGGWLKWEVKKTNTRSIPGNLRKRVDDMLADIPLTRSKLPEANASWNVNVADARMLPDEAASYTAVITSPPYPNRHDYTRVFGVELMLAFLNWDETRALRHQSFHSHPESRPSRPCHDAYLQPVRLSRIVSAIEAAKADPRVVKMLEGYFVDTYLALRELRRVSRKNAPFAIVVGNAQYLGVPVPVDELVAEIAESLGLTCDRIVAARYRGNSAQQMAKYGRSPSRESVVILRNTRSKRQPAARAGVR